MMNTVSAVTLIATSAALNRALSFVPTTSSQVTNKAMTTAGILATPPDSGPAVHIAGISMPSRALSRPTK